MERVTGLYEDFMIRHKLRVVVYMIPMLTDHTAVTCHADTYHASHVSGFKACKSVQYSLLSENPAAHI